jgi:hypothetical protein
VRQKNSRAKRVHIRPAVSSAGRYKGLLILVVLACSMRSQRNVNREVLQSGFDVF